MFCKVKLFCCDLNILNLFLRPWIPNPGPEDPWIRIRNTAKTEFPNFLVSNGFPSLLAVKGTTPSPCAASLASSILPSTAGKRSGAPTPRHLSVAATPQQQRQFTADAASHRKGLVNGSQPRYRKEETLLFCNEDLSSLSNNTLDIAEITCNIVSQNS